MDGKQIEIIADECVFLKRLITEKTEELTNLRAVLREKMDSEGRDSIRGDSYVIRQYFYKSDFSPFLTKDFKQLDAETISDLVQSELVKEYVYYRLDTMKYEAINDRNEDSSIHPFVKTRPARSMVLIYDDLKEKT